MTPGSPPDETIPAAEVVIPQTDILVQSSESTPYSGMIARVYCRVSDEDREHPDTSIRNQKTYGMQFILRLGAEIDSRTPFYIALNEKSWKPLSERKILSHALADMKAGHYQLLIVKEWDRFARGRSREDLEFLFKEAGGHVLPITGPTDEIGKDAVTFASGIIVKENRRKAIELLEKRKEIGLPVTPPPYGYTYGIRKIKLGTRTKTVSDGQWHIDPPKAEIVRTIFRAKAAGRPWQEITHTAKISRRNYYKILNRQEYLGYITYTRKIRDPNGNIVRTEPVKYKGQHEPIISQELWNGVHGKPPKIAQ